MSTRTTPICIPITAAAVSNGTAPPHGISCVGSSCALWRPVVESQASGKGLREHDDAPHYIDTGDGVCAQNPDTRPWADPAAS